MNLKKLNNGELLKLVSKIKGAIIYNTITTTPREAEHDVSEIFGDNIIMVPAYTFPGQKSNQAMIIVFEK